MRNPKEIHFKNHSTEGTILSKINLLEKPHSETISDKASKAQIPSKNKQFRIHNPITKPQMDHYLSKFQAINKNSYHKALSRMTRTQKRLSKLKKYDIKSQ